MCGVQELKVTLGGVSSVVSTSASLAPQGSSPKSPSSNALLGGGQRHYPLLKCTHMLVSLLNQESEVVNCMHLARSVLETAVRKHAA